MTGSVIRLSDACTQLRAAGIGDTDILPTIAHAGLRGRIVATGFQSIRIGGEHTAGSDRVPINRRFWRVLWSPKAPAAGFEFSAREEQLFWTRGDGDEYRQEAFACVLVDRPSFELMMADIAARALIGTLSPQETAAWISEYPGTNSREAWKAYKLEFGPRACKRDTEFHPMWMELHEHPARGQVKKSRESPGSLQIALEPA